MKKAIGTILLTISLSLLILILFLGISIKQIVEDSIQESWLSNVDLNVFKTGNDGNNSFSIDIDEEDMNSLFHDILGIDEESDDKINDFLESHQEQINEFLGIDVSSDMIHDISEAIQNKDFAGLIDKYKDGQLFHLTPEQKIALKIFRFISDVKFNGIMITLIIINILLIALVQFSFYKWIKPVSWAFIVSGILLWGIRFIINKLFASIGFSNVSLAIILRYAIILFVFGIIVRIGYFVVSIIISNMKKKETTKKEVQA